MEAAEEIGPDLVSSGGHNGASDRDDFLREMMIGDPRIAVIYGASWTPSPQISRCAFGYQADYLRGFHRDRDLATEWTRLAARW